MSSLANLSPNKESVGGSREQLTGKAGSTLPLKVKGTESKDNVFMMLLSGWIHSRHFPSLSWAGIQVQWSKSLIGKTGAVLKKQNETNRTLKREGKEKVLAGSFFFLPPCSLNKVSDI